MKPLEVVVEGTLTEDGQVVIDGKPNLPPGRVRVTLQPIEETVGVGDAVLDTLSQIWAAQERRGYQGQAWEELVAELDASRDEWDRKAAGACGSPRPSEDSDWPSPPRRGVPPDRRGLA